MEIKHLPRGCLDANQLRAKLALHIAKVVDKTEDILDLDHAEAAEDLAQTLEDDQNI